MTTSAKAEDRRCGELDSSSGRPCRRRVTVPAERCTFHAGAAAPSEDDVVYRLGHTLRRCRARSRRDPSQRCGQPAARNQAVCRYHGARSPQAIRKAAWRASLRDEVARTPQRPASQWMADTLHRLGVILLRVERDLSSPPSPEALTEYIDAVLRTHYAAKASMAAGLDEALASAVSSDGERLIDMFTRLLDAVGVGQIPELSTKISVILPAVIRGERVEESSLLVEAVEQRAEAKAARLVEAELARLRGDGLLAIAASAAAGVHGPSGGAPDSSPGGLSQTRSAGLVGAAVGAGGLPADAAASAGEIVDAELVDEPAARELGGRDPRRCPACAQDRFASDHNQHCGWNEVAGRMSLYSPLLGR